MVEISLPTTNELNAERKLYVIDATKVYWYFYYHIWNQSFFI